jgi:transcriptional regulator with XRE-family HTH domain
MKDINMVIDILKSNGISSAEYARKIGTTRQNVLNWTKGSGIPKKYLLPTVQFLSSILNRNISIENLISLTLNNDTKEQCTSTTTTQKEGVV